MLQRCAGASEWDEERYMAHLETSSLLRRDERYDEAIDADLQALKVCPHWPNAYFSLAQTYYFRQDWHKVVHWSEVGRAMPEPDSVHIMDRTSYRYGWIIFYANALYHVGAADEARAWTLRALSHCPDDEQHLSNLAFFSSLVGAPS
jgi:tetratricopeptide (TPR) repeat protein